jgi:anthranilate/para-aminobenzoate synthase component II
VIDEESLPNCLNITARSDDDCIMGVQHNERPVYGIQFHPESVLTPNGMKMIENFLNIQHQIISDVEKLVRILRK